jgi:hypothetical protein
VSSGRGVKAAYERRLVTVVFRKGLVTEREALRVGKKRL